MTDTTTGTTPHHSYRLQALHLYNWGAFAGRHQASIDGANTAIIGPTGSGKTTLIDALMTLLCANPRYNLASTGGHESDRDLVSYVRGATGPGHAGDDSDHLARTGRCATAIAAQLVRDNGEGAANDSVLIGGIFWFDGSSSSVSDMGRRWFFAQGAGHDLDVWLEEHHSGGARALGRLEKNTDGLQIFTSKTAYLTRLQRFFEVGPNAFTLLNRAAGLKQLNSIDEIFRELVLDDQSAYDDALKVANSFDELATIHAELELANRQYVALLPLRGMAQQEQAQQLRLTELRTLQVALPQWFASQGHALWQQRSADLHKQLAQLKGEIDHASIALKNARADEQARLEDYLRTGGSNIELLQSSITTQRQVLSQRQTAQSDYRKLARNLALPWPADADCTNTLLVAHQSQAVTARQQLQEQQTTHNAAAEAAVTRERNAHADLETLQAEHKAVQQRPGSNVPTEFQHFRAALADALQLETEALPFAAELMEVRKDAHAWRGAIERAIGSHRLRILVPHQAMHDALDWVNQRYNRLHVRLLEVRDAQPATFWNDGFCNKLNLKPHTHQNALRKLLADLDRHCVDSVDVLRDTPHAMTQQGLMSGKAQHFDKQDQKRLDQDWMTGFDNRDRLAQLVQQIAAAQKQWVALEQEKKAAQAVQANAAIQHRLWQSLQSLRFEDIDTAQTQAQLQRYEEQLADLLNPKSDTAQAKTRWESAKNLSGKADGSLRTLEQQQAGLQTHHRNAEAKQTDYANRLTELPADTPALTDALAQLLPGGIPTLDCDQLDRQERKVLDDLHKHLDGQTRQLTELHKDVIRQMGKALKEDRGALTDQTEELTALPHYLDRLHVLEEESLPEKRERFQDYLNTASDQGVSTLLNGIEAQVAEITDRIDQLNQTLVRVDFQAGRYLQLDPQPVVHQSLQILHKAMAQLRTERLRDDSGQSHYQALRNMVELLREHATTRSAVVVHRRGRQATLACLSWQELDAHARQRHGGPTLP